MNRKKVVSVLMCLLMITLSGCSTNYTTVSPPSEYTQKTLYPTQRPATYGECITVAIPDWKAALDSANADKQAIVDFYEGMK
ncbi:putative o-spanin [Citrobacter phage CVT22]|uniref:O-spanin n=1 Tax=Citrobacter phage CVT22 TaxID=1622234 RepID=A0A0G3BJG7_9CAUD|nr:putative o-spanin [Citrobacter phage CVT22]AKJ26690.1 putative o-spanin [Citrobacter phage CVT22]